MRRLTLAAVLLIVTGCGSGAASSSGRGGAASPAGSTAPSRPIAVEYVVIHRSWVERFVPTPPDEVKRWAEAPENAARASLPQRGASPEQIEQAYRKDRAADVAKKLGEEILVRLRGAGSSRKAIADAVDAVLGERATSDEGRPTAAVVERQRLQEARLRPAAKAALEAFARTAHPGEALPSPAVDGDVVVAARAVPGAV